jgi:hypothetical protein
VCVCVFIDINNSDNGSECEESGAEYREWNVVHTDLTFVLKTAVKFTNMYCGKLFCRNCTSWKETT